MRMSWLLAQILLSTKDSTAAIQAAIDAGDKNFRSVLFSPWNVYYFQDHPLLQVVG